MLNQWLMENRINIVDTLDNWQQAVRLSSIPLLEKDIITKDYVQAIYKQHDTFGPFYVLAPGIAMPHARPEQGAKKLGLSLLVIKQGVNFYSTDNDPIHLVIMLAAPDDHSHIKILTYLMDLLSTDEDVAQIIKAQDKQEILAIINKY